MPVSTSCCRRNHIACRRRALRSPAPSSGRVAPCGDQHRRGCVGSYDRFRSSIHQFRFCLLIPQVVIYRHGILGVAWFAFAAQYSGRDTWLTLKSLAALSILPAVTQVLVWTNQYHGLMYHIGSRRRATESLADLQETHGYMVVDRFCLQLCFDRRGRSLDDLSIRSSSRALPTSSRIAASGGNRADCCGLTLYLRGTECRVGEPCARVLCLGGSRAVLGLHALPAHGCDAGGTRIRCREPGRQSRGDRYRRPGNVSQPCRREAHLQRTRSRRRHAPDRGPGRQPRALSSLRAGKRTGGRALRGSGNTMGVTTTASFPPCGTVVGVRAGVSWFFVTPPITRWRSSH